VTRRRARLDDPESIGRMRRSARLRRLGARRVKTASAGGLRSGHGRSLVRHIAGAASGPAALPPRVFLVGKLGERIASPAVTIVDDGTVPGALGRDPSTAGPPVAAPWWWTRARCAPTART